MRRWIVGAVGVTAFGLVAWFAGDLLSLGGWRPLELPLARAALVVLAAACWIAAEVLRTQRARRANARMLALIAGAEGDSAARAAHEIEVLRKRFEEAAATLRNARFVGPDGERRYVQELPWYVFIGAPGSGKTTALVNSGLRFPLRGAGGDPSLAGVGGTRNCDWWFTEEAVLLDTAGRYTTQQSDLQADSAAWQGFLDLLRQFRPRQPLNGALVTLSVSDLMLWSDEDRKRYAWHVRARVAELYERLGMRFPLYLIVTKTDLLAGFMDLFGELDAEARARVWGATFDWSPEGPAFGTPGQRFATEFAALEQRLYDELLRRLEGEGDLQRRAAAYRFPQEFRALGPLIDQFLDAAFLGVQGAPEPLLRGVYFTSGTQEGSPIDRVLGALSRSLQLERAAPVAATGGAGKSFFLTRLLREVIFPEAGLAGRNERAERHARQLRAAGYGAIGAATALVAALWTWSYFSNRDFLTEARAETNDAMSEVQKLGAMPAGQEARLVNALTTLSELPGGYRDRQRGIALSGGFGLSQEAKLGAQALRVYQNALRDAFLPRLALSLEDDLREALRAPKGQDEVLAADLDAYLSLYAAGGNDVPLLEGAAVRLWKLPALERRDLAAHLQVALASRPEMRHPRDESIIRDARRRLGRAGS